MVKKLQRSFLPLKIERTDEPLIARAGLVLPYEMAVGFLGWARHRGKGTISRGGRPVFGEE